MMHCNTHTSIYLQLILTTKIVYSYLYNMLYIYLTLTYNIYYILQYFVFIKYVKCMFKYNMT